MTTDDASEQIELAIRPISPQTVDTVKQQFVSDMRAALKEAGHEDLLDEGSIRVTDERSFPVDQVVVIGLTLSSQIAIETYKQIILPRLRRKYSIEENETADKEKKTGDKDK